MDRERSSRDLYTPPRLRVPAALPTGPRLFREPRDKGYKGPTSEPPPGFVRGTTSKTEWMVYHAFAKVAGYPQDPREPPFIGFPGLWSYQKAWDEGRRMAGGSVVDFVYYSGARSSLDVAFRIQTEHWHLYAGMDQQTHDALQRERLAQYMRVVDLYDYNFAFDPTNQATIILIKRALNGEVEPNPINDGTTLRVTRAAYK